MEGYKMNYSDDEDDNDGYKRVTVNITESLEAVLQTLISLKFFQGRSQAIRNLTNRGIIDFLKEEFFKTLSLENISPERKAFAKKTLDYLNIEYEIIERKVTKIE